jgi:hypothetical protein
MSVRDHRQTPDELKALDRDYILDLLGIQLSLTRLKCTRSLSPQSGRVWHQHETEIGALMDVNYNWLTEIRPCWHARARAACAMPRMPM